MDITGNKYGRLTVIAFDHKDKRGEYYWRCKCDCGNETVASGNKLRTGNTKSCGCLQREHRLEGFNKTHGMTDSKLYVTWLNMRARCNKPTSLMYNNYGGRGIKVCDEWDKAFEPFMEWALSHGYEEGLTIDRIDVNGNYEPNNCRWETKKKQALNRTDNHMLTAFGKTQTIKEWADETGIKYDTIERRINAYGWSPEEAVSTTKRKRRTQ